MKLEETVHYGSREAVFLAWYMREKNRLTVWII